MPMRELLLKQFLYFLQGSLHAAPVFFYKGANKLFLYFLKGANKLFLYFFLQGSQQAVGRKITCRIDNHSRNISG